MDTSFNKIENFKFVQTINIYTLHSSLSKNFAEIIVLYCFQFLFSCIKFWFSFFKWLISSLRFSAIPPLFNGLEVLSSASDKAKLFTENFSKNSSLDNSGIYLPAFSPRTNLKLHNISVTPKMIKKVIMNLDLSKASGSDCIPVVVLKQRESELSYTLSELFNKCQKESCFPECWKVSSVVPVFKNVGERPEAKAYHPVSLYPRLLTGFGMLVLFTNVSLVEFQVRYLALFLLFSIIDGFEWF